MNFDLQYNLHPSPSAVRTLPFPRGSVLPFLSSGDSYHDSTQQVAPRVKAKHVAFACEELNRLVKNRKAEPRVYTMFTAITIH